MDLIVFSRTSRNFSDLLHIQGQQKNAPSNIQNVNVQCRFPIVPPAVAAEQLKVDMHILFDRLEAHVH
jgi:hypothetical protein